MRTIALIGPESSGKTSLAHQLHAQLGGMLVPEYARTYQPSVAMQYELSDLIHIAQVQIERIEQAQRTNPPYVWVDTEAIVMAVWAQMRFGGIPDEIDALCRQQTIEHTLILAPDLPWQPDPLRHSPELVERQAIFAAQLEQLEVRNMPHTVIQGQAQARLTAAVQAINPAISQ